MCKDAGCRITTRMSSRSETDPVSSVKDFTEPVAANRRASGRLEAGGAVDEAQGPARRGADSACGGEKGPGSILANPQLEAQVGDVIKRGEPPRVQWRPGSAAATCCGAVF